MWAALVTAAAKGFSYLIGLLQKNDIRKDVQNENAAAENKILAQDIAISDRVDSNPDLDGLCDKLNSRP